MLGFVFGYLVSTLLYLRSIWVSPGKKLLVHQQYKVGKCKNHNVRPILATFEYIESTLKYAGSTLGYIGSTLGVVGSHLKKITCILIISGWKM